MRVVRCVLSNDCTICGRGDQQPKKVLTCIEDCVGLNFVCPNLCVGRAIRRLGGIGSRRIGVGSPRKRRQSSRQGHYDNGFTFHGQIPTRRKSINPRVVKSLGDNHARRSIGKKSVGRSVGSGYVVIILESWQNQWFGGYSGDLPVRLSAVCIDAGGGRRAPTPANRQIKPVTRVIA